MINSVPKAVCVFLTALFLIASQGKTSSSSTLKIIATIPPLASLAKDLLGEAAEVTLLLEKDVSPHAYYLRPSEVRLLKKADLILWVGPDMEIFLTPLFQKGDLKTLSMTESEGVKLYPYSCDHSKDSHCSHHHDGIDPHVWLDVKNMISFLTVFKKRIESDHPNLKIDLEKQYTSLKEKLVTLDKTAQETLKNLPASFFVAHDALQYFERRYGLERSLPLSITPENGVSLKRLHEFKQKAKDKDVRCLFADIFYDPNLLKKFAGKLGLSYQVLDVLGYSDEGVPLPYEIMIKRLSTTIRNCLMKEKSS